MIGKKLLRTVPIAKLEILANAHVLVRSRRASIHEKDSGLNVIIGLYEGSKSIPVAREKGFAVVTTAEAVKRADVIFVGLPDTKQSAAYDRDIAPNLAPGKTLMFSHGFSIHFKTVVTPKNVAVVLVAPTRSLVGTASVSIGPGIAQVYNYTRRHVRPSGYSASTVLGFAARMARTLVSR